MLGGFYTMGGGHFWEDVFFYQKWRIQRNYINKHCRLLDNWDICRMEGSFDECRKAFIKYIEAFEIARQKGHMIIMLPGLGESKNIFKPLWRAALKEGYLAAAINYPSTQKDLDGHVRQLDFLLNHLEDVDQVSFVAKGIGCIILKKLFMLDTPWRKKLKMGRIVEVEPLNHGSELLHALSNNSLLNFIIGPTAKEMSPYNIERLPPLPKGIETGVIVSRPLTTGIIEKITGKTMPEYSLEEEQHFEKAKDIVEIKCRKLNMFKCPRIVDAAMSFLMTGKF